MTNKTKQTILIIILCVLVFMLIMTVNAIAHAESLDTAEVTELRIATTDCAYSMQPMGDVAEAVKAGDTVYVISTAEYEGYAGPTEYVLCNTDNGLRWLWGGFTGYETDMSVPSGEAEGMFTITTYCSCAACNGSDSGLTATGTTITPGRTIAVDPSVIPFGTHVYIDGVGERIAEDTGSAINGHIIDLAVGGHGEFGKWKARVWW